MSIRVDTSPLIASSVVIGDPGHGVLASEVPSTGEHGPGYIYDQVNGLGLTAEEVRGLITTWPASGTLTAYEDSSFEFDAPDGSYSFQYQLYVDGVATGAVQTVDITIGSGTTLTASAVADDIEFSSSASVDISADASISTADATVSSDASVEVDCSASLSLESASLESTLAAVDEREASADISIDAVGLSAEAAVNASARAEIAAEDFTTSALLSALVEGSASIDIDGASVSSELVTEGREASAELTLDGFTISAEIGEPASTGGGGSSKPRRPVDWNPTPYERKGLDKLKEAARERRLIEAARMEDDHLLEAVKKLLLEAA